MSVKRRVEKLEAHTVGGKTFVFGTGDTAVINGQTVNVDEYEAQHPGTIVRVKFGWAENEQQEAQDGKDRRV